MAISDEKVGKFVQAITEYAEEQRRKIHQEVEDFKAERLAQAEKQVLSDAYELIQKERADLRNDMSREMSRRELKARQELLGRRKAIMEDVFEEAQARLAAYATTPAYAEKLKASLAEMAALLPAEGTIYAVCGRDLSLLAGEVPAGSRLEASPEIRLGGLRGVNLDAGLMVDDTLDTKLEMQRDWFTEHSGLMVG